MNDKQDTESKKKITATDETLEELQKSIRAARKKRLTRLFKKI